MRKQDTKLTLAQWLRQKDEDRELRETPIEPLIGILEAAQKLRDKLSLTLVVDGSPALIRTTVSILDMDGLVEAIDTFDKEMEKA